MVLSRGQNWEWFAAKTRKVLGDRLSNLRRATRHQWLRSVGALLASSDTAPPTCHLQQQQQERQQDGKRDFSHGQTAETLKIRLTCLLFIPRAAKHSYRLLRIKPTDADPIDCNPLRHIWPLLRTWGLHHTSPVGLCGIAMAPPAGTSPSTVSAVAGAWWGQACWQPCLPGAEALHVSYQAQKVIVGRCAPLACLVASPLASLTCR